MSRHRMAERRHGGAPEPVFAGWLITVICLTAVVLLVMVAVLV